MKKVDKSIIVTIFVLFLIYAIYYLLTGSFIPCFFHKLTGLYCPGCGITRMIISILHFDLYQAFRFNPLIFILVICAIFYQIVKLITFKLSTKEIHLNNYIYIGLLFITIIFGIARNIPFFSNLAPTIIK